MRCLNEPAVSIPVRLPAASADISKPKEEADGEVEHSDDPYERGECDVVPDVSQAVNDGAEDVASSYVNNGSRWIGKTPERANNK